MPGKDRGSAGIPVWAPDPTTEGRRPANAQLGSWVLLGQEAGVAPASAPLPGQAVPASQSGQARAQPSMDSSPSPGDTCRSWDAAVLVLDSSTALGPARAGRLRTQQPGRTPRCRAVWGPERPLGACLSPTPARCWAWPTGRVQNQALPRPLPPQPTSPHLPATLRVPEQLRFSNREVAQAAVTVAASSVPVDLKWAAQSRAERGPSEPSYR